MPEPAEARVPHGEETLRLHFEALQASGRVQEAERFFLQLAASASPSPWLAATGLRCARSSARPELEAAFLRMALAWSYQPEDLHWLADVVGVIQYFDASRRELAALYRRYDALMQQCAERMAAPEVQRSRIPW